MFFASRLSTAALVCLAGAFLAGTPASAQAPAPAAAPMTLDVQALERGKEAINQQKYPDAIAAFEELITKFPQSAVVAEAHFRLGYAYYLQGDLEKSVASFQKVPAAKAAPPEIIELAMSLTPQVLSAQAAKLAPDDAGREPKLQEAIQQFDAYLQKFPQGDEVEGALFGRALALFQLKKYPEASQTLRANLQRFPTSETIQDSQFTLALVLGTEAVSAVLKPGGPDAAALARFDEGEKLLRDIIGKRQNLVTLNEAQFQLGEMLSARASFTEGKEAKEAAFKKALEAYRGVLSKEQVMQAQKARVESINQRRLEAGKAANVKLFRQLQRFQEKEQEKLATVEGRADQTTAARIKSGQVFFQLNRLDEARVLFSFVEQMAEDAEGKKQVLYYITMTYALQGLMDKAVERYTAFQTAHKGDEIAQNLQLVMAAGFLSKDPKVFNPEKAIQYCKEGLQIYPKGRFAADLLNVQAGALIGLKRYDEALKMLSDFIATKPPAELAASAEFNLAIIYKDTGKMTEAVKSFRQTRDKYAGTHPAEEAAYWLGELAVASDPKTAISELKAFIGKFPQSELLPQAMFALGRAQSGANLTDDAVATFRDLPKKFPKSEPAIFSYFERAKIFSNQQKFDECLSIMREFVAAYPESPAQFQAYDFMAQILSSQQKGVEAIATYDEFVQKRPNDPAAAEALLKISSLWKGYAEAQGPVLAQDAAKRAEWAKGTENSSAAAERILEKYPESPAVALALNNLLEVQKSRLRAKLLTEQELEQYFEGLARKAEGKPGTQSKIEFAYAAYLMDKDKARAAQRMTKAYKPELKYAPGDIDLYGQALLAAKEHDAALKVYEKLARDYPVPPGVDPKKAARDIQEAQAIALAGVGEALQAKGDREGGAKKFKELEQNYAWSPKMLEVNYGLALSLHEKKADDEALRRLGDVVRAPKAPAELRANAMLLLGRIHEDNKRFDVAIDNYIKIATFYSGVPQAAAEGLWRGAQLLERQARGELPMPTPAPKAASGSNTAKAPAAGFIAKP
jgi:TolA-binding protein